MGRFAGSFTRRAAGDGRFGKRGNSVGDLETTKLFAAWEGSRWPKLLLLGGDWSGREIDAQRGFVGTPGFQTLELLAALHPNGSELRAILDLKGSHNGVPRWVSARKRWLVENRIALQKVFPRDLVGGIVSQCVPRSELPNDYPMPQLEPGKFVPERLLGEVRRLQEELVASRPNVAIALGAVPSWALLAATNIGGIRGAVATAEFHPPGESEWLLKVLPTYDPRIVQKQWNLRAVFAADLGKGIRESEFPEVRRPKRRLLIQPTIEEVEAWEREALPSCQLLSADIETAKGQITCISLCESEASGIVIPFVNQERTARGSQAAWTSYWSPSHEPRAWGVVKRALDSKPVLGQNWIYDMQYLARCGIFPRAAEDTMFLHHAIYPEMQKGLGFLGSLYTNEASWKLMRRNRKEGVKSDE